MPVKLEVYFSDFFQVSPFLLDEYGAFDISLINDLPLFIDPFLLFNSDKEIYKRLHEDIIDYLRFLRAKSATEGIKQGLKDSWYRFAEVRQTWLGYSGVGNYGRGLGSDFADALHSNLHTIFRDFGKEEITRSSHLEKLCLIKNAVGRDNISDFTTNLIKKYLLEYTQTFAVKYINPKLRKKFAVSKVNFNYHTQSWQIGVYDLPSYVNDFVLLTPKDMLTRDETWINNADFRSLKTFTEIAEALPNEQLRAQVNDYLQRALSDDPSTKRRKSQKEKQKEIHEAIDTLINEHPELIDHYVRYKEEHEEQATTISEQKVELAETVFIEKVRQLVNTLTEQTSFYEADTLPSTYEEVHVRVAILKEIIENKGGQRVFYLDGEPLRRQSDLDILFRLVWYATKLDTKDVNERRNKPFPEFKLSTNSQLNRKLQKQSESYQEPSHSSRMIIVILFFSYEEQQKLQSMLQDLKLLGSKDIVLIDARSSNKPADV